jgi:hypothetical protein
MHGPYRLNWWNRPYRPYRINWWNRPYRPYRPYR